MKGLLPALTRGWERFFHAPADPGVYTRFRIGFGILLLVYFTVLGPDWLRWFGTDGVLDPESARRNIAVGTWSLFWWFPGAPWVLWTCLAVILVQIAALILGVRPRFQAACLFVWLVSLHHRNNLIWDGEDVLFRIACFLLIWMPSGQAVPLGAAGAGTKNQLPGIVAAWPLRLLQIELSCLYLSAVLSKWQGPAWRNGTALHYVAGLDEFFGRLPLPQEIFDLWWVVALLSWLTIAVESLLVFGVWVRGMRLATVTIGILFHLAIELTMNLFLFQWLMILILSTHLTGDDLTRFRQSLRRWGGPLHQP